MRTAIDSSVILDVLIGSDRAASRAEDALRKAHAEGQLFVCETVVVEISPELDDVPAFLTEWQVEFVPGTLESALLAARMFSAYLARKGARARVVPDFLVGAHAKTFGERLLTRDRGFYRDYFKGLKLLEP